ncbi:MAG: TonB-dependent receptor [Deltaproteobacteria bacterium]
MFVHRLLACLVVSTLSASAGAQTPPSEPSPGVATEPSISDEAPAWGTPNEPDLPATGAPARRLAVDTLTAVGKKKPGPKPARAARTASKTDTQLQDLPAAVVIVPEEVLHQQDAQTLDQAARNASGVTPVMGGSYGFADRYLMRGLSQRFLRDGLPDGPSFNGYFRSMTDVERIEVLKGPASALYGRTEPGGLINIVTKRPLFVRDWLVETGAGSFGSSKLIVSGGEPLSPDVGARVDASYQHTDGYRRLARTVWEVMPSLEFRLGDAHTLLVDYDLRSNEIVPDNYGIPFAPIDPLAPVQNRRPLRVDPENRYYSPFNEVSQILHRLTLRHEWRASDALELRTAAAFDARGLQILRNAGGAVASTADGLSQTARTAREQQDRARYFVFQNELVARGSTGPLEHTLLVGLEAEQARIKTRRDDIAVPNIADVFAPVIQEAGLSDFERVPSYDRRLRSSSIGVYAQEQVGLWSLIQLRASGRFDRVNFIDAGVAHYPLNASPLANRRITSTKGLTTGQIGALVRPIPELSLYSGVATGKFMNIQTESPNLTTKPESSFQVEAGVKTALLDERLQANVAGFWTRRSDFYVTPFGGTDPEPVGEQTTTGVELGLLVLAASGLTINMNYAYYRARISSDQQQALGMQSVNIDGKKPQGVPDQVGNLWVAYELDQSALKGLGLGAGLRYQGEAFADALNLNRVPPYALVDASIFFRERQFEVQLNLRNLAGAEYFSHPTFSGAAPGEPRVAYATLRYRY